MAVNPRNIKVSNGLYYTALAAFVISLAATLLGHDTAWGVTLVVGYALIIAGFITARLP